MPSREFDIKAIESTGISKLWYALTEANDLLIIKFVSDDTHADGVAELTSLVRNFTGQFGTVENAVCSYSGDDKKVLVPQTKIAPDALLNRNFPEQPTPVDPRRPFIAKLECEQRGPKELMQQLSTYVMQPEADYFLGVKACKRSGPAVATGKRPFSAVAKTGAVVYGHCPQDANQFCWRRDSSEHAHWLSS